MNNTLNKFFQYWKKKNYGQMYAYCQKTWQFNHTKSELKAMFVNLDLLKYEIKSMDEGLECARVFECEVTVNGQVKKCTPKLICEKAAFKPDLSGIWGVNPISVIRLL